MFSFGEIPQHAELRALFEDLYLRYNRREFVHPDPVELLYCYQETGDREVAALLAAALAYGRASQIVKKASQVLEVMGASPKGFVLSHSLNELQKVFKDFKHRFTDGKSVAGLFYGIRGVLLEYGSLEMCAECYVNEGHLKAKEAITGLFESLLRHGMPSSVLPDPRKPSACKRLYLFLKWMIRKDSIDPGGWSALKPSELIYPLDTHIFSIARALGATDRKSADFKAALDVTEFFRRINPLDPLKYDFVLTRFGIRPDLNKKEFLEICCGNRMKKGH